MKGVQIMETITKLIYTYPKPDYKEEFKSITYPGIKKDKYLISNHGRVYNINTNKFMKTYFDDDNHEKITLVTDVKHPRKRGNKSKHYFIHRLMAWEFIGPPPDEYHTVINHKNGIPCCNFIHNIEWASMLENTNHAKRYGLLKNSGTDSKICKYDEKLIRRICSLFEEGYHNKEIFEIIKTMKRFDNPETHSGLYNLINKLGKRTSYRNIVCDYNYLPPKEFFKCDDVTEKIRSMILDGKTNFEIMHEFNINEIKDNRSFYNKIIYERAKCNVILIDYPKGVGETEMVSS